MFWEHAQCILLTELADLYIVYSVKLQAVVHRVPGVHDDLCHWRCS